MKHERLFVISAGTREQLVECLREARTALTPETDVAELAIAMGAQSADSTRLAIVASTSKELSDRLDKAILRLEDPKRTKIRDSAGIYYVDNPLHEPGNVAFLYPGEGAQYLGMIEGLKDRYPSIEHALQVCDEIECRMKLPRGAIRRSLFSTTDDGAEIEKMMQDFSFSIFAVMACSWCLDAVLETLQVKPGVIAGHSAGESTALFVAGAIRQDTPLTVLEAIADIGKHDGSDSAMLAVGASKSKVETLLTAEGLLGGDAELFVAMDNCPHQVIVVGRSMPISKADALLKQANLIVQRLSIPRPYHTPLFHPYMPALRALFGKLQFEQPDVPLYSCTTAKPFGNDPAEIRNLAIEHWEQPVEFTQLVRQMYDDGVRVFVEVGPRGNLTSFCEDILRGRPAAIVSANRMGRSAPLQIAHLAAELWVHHVPISLAAVIGPPAKQTSAEESQAGAVSSGPPIPAIPIAGRTVANQGPTNQDATDRQSIESSPRFAPLPSESAHATVPAPRPSTLARSRSGRPRKQRIWEAIHRTRTAPATDAKQQTIVAHQQLMKKFLETQHAVMSGYLHERPTDAATSGVTPVGRRVPTPPLIAPSRETTPPPTGMPLAGQVVEHVAEQSLTIRRALDLHEDRYADQHTVGGQVISRVDPNQHGLPVMPMTFFLEMIAETAKQLFPEWHVTNLVKVRLRKWLPFFEGDPGSVEVRVTRVANERLDQITLNAEVTDLGTSRHAMRDGTKGQAAVCRVVMKRHHEDGHVPEYEFDGARPCEVNFEQLYMNLFHGPLLQGVTTFDRIDDKQIECSATVQQRKGLFTSTDAPDFLLDPVTLDIVMHPLAAWHLSQEDQSGRIMLPFELDEVEFFGGPPEVGDRLYVQGQLTQESARHFVHNLVVRRADGSAWCQMRGAKFWRFYLPFRQVNFHGPKDIYYISDDQSQWLPSDEAIKSRSELSRFSSSRMTCICLDPPQDLVQGSLQEAAACVVFGSGERGEYEQLKGRPADKFAWIFQRFAAKDVVRWHRQRNFDITTFAADITLDSIVATPSLAKFRSAAREGFDKRPFPDVLTAVDRKIFSVCCFEDCFGLGVTNLDDPVASHAWSDALGKIDNDDAVGAARLQSAIAAIQSTEMAGRPGQLDSRRSVTDGTINQIHWHPDRPGCGLLEFLTPDGSWLVWSMLQEDSLVSVALPSEETQRTED